MDIYTRESLAIEVSQSLKGADVVRVLSRLKEQRGVPKALFCDNGSEFTGQMMDMWAYRNGVKIDFSRPGKPTDNAYVESFNGSFRDECLDTNWFQSLPEARPAMLERSVDCLDCCLQYHLVCCFRKQNINLPALDHEPMDPWPD